jgi:transcriptional regulator with XRE-family HTH domain
MPVFYLGVQIGHRIKSTLRFNSGGESMTLGEFVLNYRLKCGLSQRQFAIRCGVSNGYVSMIEKNINPKTQQPLVPSIPVLTKIASGMGLSLNELFRLVDDMTGTSEEVIEMETIAERINKILKVKGIKKTEMAKRLKISDSSVSTICSGKTNPSGQTITMICNEFGVREEWLRTGEGEMFVPTSTSALDALASKYPNMTQDTYVLIEKLFGLSASDQNVITGFLKEVMNMATEKMRYTVSVDQDLFQKIEDFRFEKRFQTRSEATVELIRLGLETQEKRHSQEVALCQQKNRATQS